MKTFNWHAINKFLATILFLGVAVACEDLVEDPRGDLTVDSFYKTERDLDAGITACFFPLVGNGSSGYDTRLFSLMAGDEQLTSRHGSNKERVLEFDEFGVSTSNIDLFRLWRVNYESITAANTVIAKADQIQMNEEVKKKKLAQVYFIRAYVYYNLVRWFGKVPLLTEPVEGEGKDVRRNSVEDVYNQIIADAKFAEEHLPLTWDQRGRPTKGAAKTLLSSVYLTTAGWPLNKTENYTLAAQKAKEVIEMNAYSLFDSFEEIWLPENEDKQEWIFSLQGSIDGGTRTYMGKSFMPPEEGGWVDYFSEPEFYLNYPAGERRDVTFHTTFITKKGDTIPWQEGAMESPFINKYRYAFEYIPGESPPSKTNNNFPVFRYAEVLLTYAEAINKANGAPDALAYESLNHVRKRAFGEDLTGYSDLQGLSSEEFDQAVLQERNWELAFECKRWYDLVRREMVEQANTHNIDRLRNPITKDRYIFPVPQREIDVNSDLQQNPGYD